ALAASLTSTGNDNTYAGVHDANLLFRARAEATISVREKRLLVDTGLYHASTQAAPVFHWLFNLGRDVSEYVSLPAWVGLSDREKQGAIEVLRLLALPLDRDVIDASVWPLIFSPETPADTKVGFLRYLEENGIEEDLVVAREEFDRSN